MKFLALSLLLAVAASAQVVRVEPFYGYALPQNPVPNAARLLTTTPGSQVFLCNDKSIPCTSLAVTYMSETGAAQCPATAQATVHSSPVCISTFGSDGTFGFWVASRSTPYWYSFILAGSQQGTINGPFPISAGGGGGSGGGAVGPTGSIQTNAGSGNFGYLANPLPVANGGTGTATPGLVSGAGITITNAWPNQTVSLTGAPTVYVGTPVDEVPSGTINGSNTTFTLSQLPNANSLTVYENGLAQFPGVGNDFTISVQTITFATAPPTGTRLEAKYQYGMTPGGGGGSGNATSINGGSVPANAVLGTNGASQPLDITAAILNSSGKAVLRDNKNAIDVGNIAGAITACGTSVSCSVLVPPSYSGGDAVPCQSINWFLNSPGANPCTTANNIATIDQRYGDYRVIVNPWGQNTGNTRVPWNWQIINNDPNAWLNASNFENFFAFNISQENRAGGINVNQLGYPNKSNFQVFNIKQQNITEGQHIPFSITNSCGGNGDCFGLSLSAETGGAMTAATDEGNHAYDIHIGTFQGSYGGTITGVTGNVITVTNTQEPDTQGQGRSLIDLNPANIINSGTMTISTGGGAPAQVTFSTTKPVPTVVAQLGTSVPTPGVPIVITPTSFTTGSIAGITTSSKLCVADGGGLDYIQPTAVSGSTFTATFRFPHTTTAVLQKGGLCGYGIDFIADELTSSSPYAPTIFPSIAPVGTIRTIWPVFSNTATTALVYNNTGDLWNPLVSQATSTKNTYALYPMCQVVAATDGGFVNNISGSRNPDTFTCAPSTTAWTSGDAVEETMGPITQHELGIIEAHFYQPTGSFTAQTILPVYASGPMQGSDSFLLLQNNEPDAAYGSYNDGSGNHGTLLGPHVLQINGKHQEAIEFQQPGDFGQIVESCPNAPALCTGSSTILTMYNNNGNNGTGGTQADRINYDKSGQSGWTIYSGTGNTSIQTLNPNVAVPGSGYAIGDTFSIVQTGCTGTNATVVQIGSGGVPQALAMNSTHHGTGCAVATGLSTTTLTGSGTGMKVDITSLETSANFITPQWFSTNLINLHGATLAQTPGCWDEVEGAMALILDSQSQSPGAIITGGGGTKVLAACTTHHWTVMGGYKPANTINVNGTTGNLGTTVVCTAQQCINGNYTLSLAPVITTTGGTGTITFNVQYGDGYASNNLVVTTITDPHVPGSFLVPIVSLHTDGSGPITITATSTTGSTYNIAATASLQ